MADLRGFVRGFSVSPAHLRALVRRIEEGTPAGRDRAADALRGLAILGVILGHWLVTAVVDTGESTLEVVSPLRYMPWLAPISWVLQTLAVFFLVGGQVAALGYARARASGIGYGRWLGGRLARLTRPVGPVLGVWAVAAAVMLVSGTDFGTLRTLLLLVLSPLWFLLVFALLTAATPLVARVGPLWPLAAVACADLVRFGIGGPDWLGRLLGPVSVLAGWLVPYTLGAAWARGRYDSRRCGLLLVIAGTAGTAGLVVWAGYPASMVGVPGERVSNLNPPTLAVVAFGLAQCGLALLLRGRLRRMMARPAAWAAVAVLNLSAMTIFLWHQTAMLVVTASALPFGPLPGLHTTPDGLGWVAARIGWLPPFAIALVVCWAAFRTAEQSRAVGPDRVTERAGSAGGAVQPRGVVPSGWSAPPSGTEQADGAVPRRGPWRGAGRAESGACRERVGDRRRGGAWAAVTRQERADAKEEHV